MVADVSLQQTTEERRVPHPSASSWALHACMLDTFVVRTVPQFVLLGSQHSVIASNAKEWDANATIIMDDRFRDLSARQKTQCPHRQILSSTDQLDSGHAGEVKWFTRFARLQPLPMRFHWEAAHLLLTAVVSTRMSAAAIDDSRDLLDKKSPSLRIPSAWWPCLIWLWLVPTWERGSTKACTVQEPLVHEQLWM